MTRSKWWEIPALVVCLGLGVAGAVRGTNTAAVTRAREAEKGYVFERMFAAIQPVHVTNCDLKRFGDKHDGGYLVCGNLLGAVTTGYSYGIAGTDEWGCQVSRELHVDMHEYDCFDLRQPACPGGRLIFHPECVGATRSVEDGLPFDSIAGQFERNGDTANRLVVKMDVEGAEWPAFLASPDSVFAHIDQLVMEFHRMDDMSYVRTIERLKRFFVIAHVHYNNFGCDPRMRPLSGRAVEALLVNRRLAKTDGTPVALGTTALDAPNSPDLPDCQNVPGS